MGNETLFAQLQALLPLSPALLDYLDTHLQPRSFDRKAALLKIGHVCEQVFFIEQGLVRTYHLLQQREVTVSFGLAGDWVLAPQSFFQRQVSHQAIQALEITHTQSLRWQDLDFMYRTFPEAERLGRLLLQQQYIRSEHQQRGLRLASGLARYQWLQEHYGELVLRVPVKYLASYLNITENYLSALRNKEGKAPF